MGDRFNVLGKTDSGTGLQYRGYISASFCKWTRYYQGYCTYTVSINYTRNKQYGILKSDFLHLFYFSKRSVRHIYIFILIPFCGRCAGQQAVSAHLDLISLCGPQQCSPQHLTHSNFSLFLGHRWLFRNNSTHPKWPGTKSSNIRTS